MEVSLDESFSCAMELEVSLLAKTCVFKIQAVAQPSKAAQLSVYFPLCPPAP